jgi:hypothetical protein
MAKAVAGQIRDANGEIGEASGEQVYLELFDEQVAALRSIAQARAP